MSTSTNTRAQSVTAIGKGTRLTAEVAAEIVASVPAEYDWSARGAVPKAIDAFVAETGAVPVKQRGGKGEQTLTDYGRGCDTLRKAVAALVKGDAPKATRLAVTMSGDDAPVTGTATTDPESDLGRALIEYLTAAQAADGE